MLQLGTWGSPAKEWLRFLFSVIIDTLPNRRTCICGRPSRIDLLLDAAYDATTNRTFVAWLGKK